MPELKPFPLPVSIPLFIIRNRKLYLKIQRMIIAGDIPTTLTLTKFNSDFPEDWDDQEHHFGMREETVS